MTGALSAAWGVGGVLLLIGSAIYRLTPLALGAFSESLGGLHWLILVLWVAFMVYSEGYRGFQRGFSPRVAARARYLKENPRLLYAVLAPFHCMGLVQATRRRLVGSWLLVLMIVALVIAVQRLEQPWRGIVDAGVVAGLGWGFVSLLYFTYRAFTQETFSYPIDVPNA